MNPDVNKIKEQAQKEIDQENFRTAVEAMKQKLKRRRWWHKLLPLKVVIVRRESWK